MSQLTCFSRVYVKRICKQKEEGISCEIWSREPGGFTSRFGYDIEIYNTTGAIGAARAANLHKGDFKAFGKTVLDNDYVMTFSPKEDKTAYKNAYATWKNELELILNNL